MRSQGVGVWRSAWAVGLLAGRVRFRGWRLPVLLGVTTGLAIAITVIALQMVAPLLMDTSAMGPDGAQQYVGYGFVAGLYLFQSLLAYLLVPALAGGALGAERAPGTWDFLRLTRLSVFGLLLGKMSVALLPVLYAQLALLPVLGICLMLGGVSPGQLLWGSGVLAAQVLMLGGIGVYSAARFRHPATALVMAYVLGCALCIYPAVGSSLGMVIISVLDHFAANQEALYVGVLCTMAFLPYLLLLLPALLRPLARVFARRLGRAIRVALSVVAIIGLALALSIALMLLSMVSEPLQAGVAAGIAYAISLTSTFTGLVGAFAPWDLFGGGGAVPGWLERTLVPATLAFHLLVAAMACWRAGARLRAQWTADAV